jgi:hypothetical protein
MAKIIKILSGRRWRTFARDIGGDARQRSPAEKLDELEVELTLSLALGPTLTITTSITLPLALIPTPTLTLTIALTLTLTLTQVEVHSVAQIGQLLLDDMQKAFGINTARPKQNLLRCERGFDRLFFFVHQALRLGAVPGQTPGGMWRELQREVEQLLPRRARRLRLHRGGTFGKVLHLPQP